MKVSLAVSILVGALTWQVATHAETQATTPTATVQSPPKLGYGIEDVVKLHRAGLGESVIVSFIDNSRSSYNLSPSEIVYLKDQGLSENVINRMLEKNRIAASQPTYNWSPNPGADETSAPSTPPKAQPAPQPAPVYTQPPAPDPAPSTVHVIPYRPARYVYYGSYVPYYYPSWSYGFGYYGGPYCGSAWGPSISFGFRFGGHGHSHGHH